MNIANNISPGQMCFTTWKHRLLGGGMVALLLLLTSCEEFSVVFYSSLREHDPPPWRGESVAVDLTGVLHPLVYEMEFAAQNAPYLGFWTLAPTASDTEYELANSGQIRSGASGRYVIIDFQGNMMADAVTATGALSDGYVDLFPTIAAKQRYTEFLQDAEFWAFSPDGAYGMKSDICYEDTTGTHIMSCKDYTRESINFEFWDLTRDELLWENIVKGYAIKFAQLLVWQDQPAVLHRADILSQATGATLGSFEYAPLRGDNVGRLLFSGNHIAYHTDARWLACGDFDSRRVRLYGIDPPYSLLRELDQPPRSLAWRVDGVTLNGNARYLTVATRFSPMMARHLRFPTEVYDVTTWKRVWYENRENIGDVIVSPNGQKIAFMRSGPIDEWHRDISTVVKKVVELGDFYPEETP